MGRGGTKTLWPQGKAFTPPAAPPEGTAPQCQCGRSVGSSIVSRSPQQLFAASTAPSFQGYRIKPYGQLVRLSSTCCHACTRRLSTSWSTTTLQGAQGSGKSHLEASFPLRCFQRLSLPSLATRQYDWRHNRYTRGSSTPVLSY